MAGGLKTTGNGDGWACFRGRGSNYSTYRYSYYRPALCPLANARLCRLYSHTVSWTSPRPPHPQCICMQQQHSRHVRFIERARTHLHAQAQPTPPRQVLFLFGSWLVPDIVRTLGSELRVWRSNPNPLMHSDTL